MATIPLENNQAVPASRTRKEALLLDDMTNLAAWTLQGADSVDLTQEDDHVLGTKSLQFSKTGVTVQVAGIQSLARPPVDASNLGADAVLELIADIPSTTNLASVEVRVGTDASNYASFLFADTEFTDGDNWDTLTKAIGSMSKTGQAGTGLDLSNITYLEVVVNFDANANTLVDIHIDAILLRAA